MKKMIVSVALTLAAALACSTGFAAEKTLAAKHGGMWPKSQNGFVTKNQCMKCHGTYDALAKKTAKLEPNPHFNHMGQVNCEDCHKANKAKPELMCDSCHQFKVKEKAAK
ncbi:MAG: cytochrome c3 family protein [Duodenibacillus sp.]